MTPGQQLAESFIRAFLETTDSTEAKTVLPLCSNIRPEGKVAGVKVEGMLNGTRPISGSLSPNAPPNIGFSNQVCCTNSN